MNTKEINTIPNDIKTWLTALLRNRYQEGNKESVDQRPIYF